MNRSAFRRFDFFDVETLVDDLSVVLGSTPSCAVAEGDVLIFGDKSGYITTTDRHIFTEEVKGNDLSTGEERKKRYKVFRGEVKGLVNISTNYYGRQQQFIVTIGDDSKPISSSSESNEAHQPFPAMLLIKIFSVHDMARPVQILNATPGSHTTFLTSFAVLNDGSQIAVGFNTGTVLLFSPMGGQPPIPHAAAHMALSRSQSQPVMLHQVKEGGAPVSSLVYSELPAIPAQAKADTTSRYRRIRLFVVFDRKDADPEASADPLDAGIIIFDTSMVWNSAPNPTHANDGFFAAAPNRQAPKDLDERGAQSNATTYMKDTYELLVGRSDAVYSYSVEDRGGAMAIFGEKLCLCSAGRYTLVVSLEEKTIGGGMSKRPTVTVYDTKHKVICGTTKKYQLPANEKILLAMSDTSCASTYLVTSSKSLIRFREKETTRKIEVLLSCKPPLYSTAIVLAAEEQMDASEIMKLYKQYGDHLYEKYDFDAAIAQYCNTIGYTPPSYVVMKFLDPYRTSNLITYLEQLKAKSLASMVHVNLMLTCYIKTKDETKIKDLLTDIYTVADSNAGIRGSNESQSNLTIKASSATGHPSSSGTLKRGGGLMEGWSAAQVISMLTAGGYAQHALQVALKFKQHESYLQIQLSKRPPLCDDALAYMAFISLTTSGHDLLYLLRLFGRQLLSLRPTAFTFLLTKLCLADYEAFLPSTPGTSSSSPNPSFTDRDSGQDGSLGEAVANALAAHLHEVAVKPPHVPLQVSDLLSLFTADSEHLFQLLEGVVQGMKGRVIPPKVSNTLIELYLTKLKAARAVSNDDVDRVERVQRLESQIMMLLDGPYVQYDVSQALLLVYAYDFERGRRFLLEKQQSVELLMVTLMEARDTVEIFKLLHRDGRKDPELFLQVLAFLVEDAVVDEKRSGTVHGNAVVGNKEDNDNDSDSDDEDASKDENDDARWDLIIDMIDIIEKEAILSPMQVLTTLAKNPALPLHIASSYIGKSVRDLTDSIHDLEGDVNSSLVNLDTLARQGQQQAAGALPEPAQHRKSRHRNGGGNGYYDDDEDEDYEDEDDEDEDANDRTAALIQAKEKEKWHSIRKAQLDCSHDDEAFYKELELSTEGFSTVAGFFGRSFISPS